MFHICKYLWNLAETVRSLGAGVTSYCDQLGMGAQN